MEDVVTEESEDSTEEPNQWERLGNLIRERVQASFNSEDFGSNVQRIVREEIATWQSKQKKKDPSNSSSKDSPLSSPQEMKTPSFLANLLDGKNRS